MDKKIEIIICLFLGLAFLLGGSIFYIVGIAFGRALSYTIPVLTMFFAIFSGAYISTVRKEAWIAHRYRILWTVCAVILVACVAVGAFGWHFFRNW